MLETTTRPHTPYSRFNIFAFLWDIITYYAGSTLLSTVTILPLFASELAPALTHATGAGPWAAFRNHLINRDVIVALIPAMAMFGLLLPQVIGARLVSGRDRYRPMVVRLGLIERTFLLSIVVSMYLLAHASPALLLSVPLGFVFAWFFVMGLNHPGYTAMLEHTIPVELRGRLFGGGAALGGVVGFAVAMLAKWFLQRLEFPYGFVACAGVAWIILASGLIPLAFVRETPWPQPKEEEGTIHGRILSVLRTDRPFYLFVGSQILFAFQMMVSAVYTTYALKRFQASPGDIAVLAAVMAIAGGVGYIVLGPLADRHGNRAVLFWSTLLTGVCTLAAWLAPTLGWYTAAFVPISLANSGWQLTGFNIVMEFAPRGRVHIYTAAAAAVPGPFRVMAPLLGGILVAQLGRHGPVFAAAAIAALASAAMLAFVREPREKG
ncbi:MAG TPA: MFS transporter [Armatimonadota bacterium]|jgi:MFS family permease